MPLATSQPDVVAAMDRIEPGMGCCRVAREHVGLSCDRGQQLACGRAALACRLDRAPEDAGRLFKSLMSTFPDRLAMFAGEAVQAGCVDAFIRVAARVCAALPTKAERHSFRDQFAGCITADDLSAFDTQMAAEWRRLRGK